MKRQLNSKPFSGKNIWAFFALPLIGFVNAAVKWAEASERIQGTVDGIFIGYVLALMVFNIQVLRMRGSR